MWKTADRLLRFDACSLRLAWYFMEKISIRPGKGNRKDVPLSALWEVFFPTSAHYMRSSTSHWNYNALFRIRVSCRELYFRVSSACESCPREETWRISPIITHFFHIFRCPHLTEEYSIAIPIYDGIVTLIVLASFANASVKDPGIIPRGRDFLSSFVSLS